MLANCNCKYHCYNYIITYSCLPYAMKRSNKFLLFLICCQFFLSSILAEDNKYAFTEAHVELSNEIIQILENYHFTKKKYPSIKKEALDTYLDRLDPSRSIFLQKEVNSFFSEDINDLSLIHISEPTRPY